MGNVGNGVGAGEGSTEGVGVGVGLIPGGSVWVKAGASKVPASIKCSFNWGKFMGGRGKDPVRALKVASGLRQLGAFPFDPRAGVSS
jgi:hypothetical protein